MFTNTVQIAFPTKEYKVQSPFLYLQAAGSTGADGSTYGAQVRWLPMRNLDSHLPKGDSAKTTTNFNRPGDFVQLYRSRYLSKFPTLIDFAAQPPNIVSDSDRLWIYLKNNTNTTVYIYFREAAKYDTTRHSVDPATKTQQFLELYADGLIEVEVKDKLFFAFEFGITRASNEAVLKAEALSVIENVPLSAVFVTCRRSFAKNNWCGEKASSGSPCSGNNLLVNGGFEGGATGFVTDYILKGPAGEGSIWVIDDARNINPLWKGTAYKGTNFLAVDGSAMPEKLVWQQRVIVEDNSTYVFLGALATLSDFPPAVIEVRLQIPGTTTVVTLTVQAPVNVGVWKPFQVEWNSGTVGSVVISIVATSNDALGNDFGIDDLVFCKKRDSDEVIENDEALDNEVGRVVARTPAGVVYRQVLMDPANEERHTTPDGVVWIAVREAFVDGAVITTPFTIHWKAFPEGQTTRCGPRLVSENVRSVRFLLTDAVVKTLSIETYNEYIGGAQWEPLDSLALTTVDGVAFSRLEPAPDSVKGHWKKFNDQALLNTANYEHRWTRVGGLREGVERYIKLSDNDPLATDELQGAVQPQDGAIKVSMLGALRMVSLDFHVARMLGLGYLDRDITTDTDEFIYLGVYDTDGPLDDSNLARPVRHYYMGIPTSPLDYRLPEAPVLKPVTYGLTVDNGEHQPALLTDPQGYTPDGIARYVNLFVEPDTDTGSLGPFFQPPDEFCGIEKTSSVFYGVEYRKQGEAAWRKPEIAHDSEYQDLDSPQQYETLPLPNNAGSEKPILRHEERENGIHEYGGYSINWFSRVSQVGNVVATDATFIKKAARLLPPTNFAVQLIQPESPLMLTTASEQNALANLTTLDHTLVRVTFDYFHVHDINYAFADSVELLFRPELPRNVAGAIASVTDDPVDSRNAILRTTDYTMNSQGTTVAPVLDPALFSNFVGGVLSCQQQNYIVTNVSSSTVSGEGPVFTIQKNVQGTAIDPGSTGAFLTVQKYIEPDMGASDGQLMFMALENMGDASSWGTLNPLSKTIVIGDSSWTTEQETYVRDGETITANLRGVWSAATVTADFSAGTGVYRIEFQTYVISNHPQFQDPDPVEWYKGAVRIPRHSDPSAPKKALEVLLMDHSSDGKLVLHVIDNEYDAGDLIVTGPMVTVNYYPGYKVYLHADLSHNFTASAILPAAGEGNRKTWLGARSRDTAQQYFSPVGIPAPIIAMEFVQPLPPAQPQGGEFATWPDVYYKSSYTFRLGFATGHKPFAAVMYRANDEAILRTLYKDDTYLSVRQQLELLGEDDSYRADRWRNLLGFDYVYDVAGHPYFDPTHSSINGTFRKFPAGVGYAFPNPDKVGTFDGSSPGSVLAALQEEIWGAFTALTEMPLIFDYIRGPSYVPVPKPQNIRNAQGTLLPPNDPAFDMAPMAKRTGNGFEIQFTDFTLDGTGSNVFFYCGREIGNRGRLGDPGPIAGPVQLINTRPPDAPAVKKMYVREPNLLGGTGPAVNFEVNAYPAVQNVRRMLIYRTTEPGEALSVRTMKLVKTVDIDGTNQAGKLSVALSDDFESGFVPYGDPLFYRIVALRRVKKPDGGTDWAPSQPSKVLLTTMIDTINPEAPEITFASDGPSTLTGVILSWPATTYNGTYYLDKMSTVGNWLTIYRFRSNELVTVNLAATDLGSNVLPKESEGRPVYHRFRVRVENSSGLLSLNDKVLTL